MNTKKYRIYFLFALITVLQLLTIIYSFQVRKEGTHSDELWSYGYANSFFTREFFVDDDGNDIKLNEWRDCEELWDYLVVNEGEAFRFDSVYYNKANDNSPFLHSMVLHAICSFFPESFSLWYSFSINIVSFLVCMIFLFQLARLMKNDTFAICCCIWYGCSLAARDTYIYLRMYAMSTAMMMAYLYFTVKYIKTIAEGKKPKITYLLLIVLIAWLSFITNLYNVSFVGIATFFFCLYLLCKKKLKVMLSYGIGMLAALGASYLAFPNMFDIVISYHNEKTLANGHYSLVMLMKVCLNFILAKTCGIVIDVFYNPTLDIFLGVLIYLVILSIPLMIFLRNTAFMKRAAAKGKDIAAHPKHSLLHLLHKINWMYVIFFLTMLFQVIVICKSAQIENMGVYADRYLMYLYPLAVMVMFGVFWWLIELVWKRRQRITIYVALAASLFLVCLNLYSRVAFTVYFFCTETEGEEISEVVSGKNCIYVNAATWQIVSISNRLMYGNEYFHTLPDEYMNYTSEYMEKIFEGEVYLLVNTEGFATVDDKLGEIEEAYGVIIDQEQETVEEDTSYQDMIDYFEALVPETKMIQVSSEDIFDRTVVTYLINP